MPIVDFYGLSFIHSGNYFILDLFAVQSELLVELTVQVFVSTEILMTK